MALNSPIYDLFATDHDGDMQHISRMFYHIVTAGTPSAVEVCHVEDPEKAKTGLKVPASVQHIG